MALPSITQIDDLLLFNATKAPVNKDKTEPNNTFSLEQVLIGSIDPNDIPRYWKAKVFPSMRWMIIYITSFVFKTPELLLQ